MSSLGRSVLRRDRWSLSRLWQSAAVPQRLRRRRTQQLEALEKRIVLSVFPVGPEQALTAPLDGQFQFTSRGRSAAADNDGDFALVWSEFNGPDGFDVFVQMYDRSGDELSVPTQVNETVPGDQEEPVIAMDADGEFVVAWTGPGPEYGSLDDIWARRYSSVGVPLGSEFRVNNNITNPQGQPAIAMDADGNFTIAWATNGQILSFFNNIRVQRYDREATPLGPEFGVHVDDANEHFAPDVGMSPAGDRIMIAWTELLHAGPGPVIETTVWGALLDGEGRTLRSQFVVESGRNPSVDFDSAGNFFVAFETIRNNDFGLDPPVRSFDILGRPYDRDGNFISRFQGNLFINESDRNIPRTTGQDLQFWPYGDPDSGRLIDVDPDPMRFRPFFFGDYAGLGTGNTSVALDADFDFLVTYEGMGAEQFFPPSDGYGILGSQWDAAPFPGLVFGNFGSDFPLQSTLDGQNSEWHLKFAAFPPITGGTFTLFFTYPGVAIQQTAAITYDPAAPNITAANIDTALEALAITGFLSSVTVTAVDAFNFDIFFHTSLHSTGVVLAVGDSDLTTDIPDMEGMIESLVETQQGFPGSVQFNASIAMEPDGDFVVIWTGENRGDVNPGPPFVEGTLDTTIYYRRFNETTDTAGPTVTDVIAPGGNRIEAGEVLPAAISTLTLTFDEEMLRSTVEDVENYALVQNGDEELIGAIMSATLFPNPVTPGLNPATNKWEVLLTLDANGPEPGVAPLEEGDYEIVAVNRLRDKSRVPLGLTGYNPNGQSFSRNFSIQLPAGTETRANSTTSGDQYTEREATQPVAADSDGDFVVVWTSDGQDGNLAGVYAQLFDANGSPRGSEFRVNTSTTGDQRHASVAMSATGDFVVTWSSFNSSTNWDVYGQQFSATGVPVGREFVINSTLSSAQRFSTIAVDTDGDFVVAWQSFNQDGSGYGVYSQRYDRLGTRLDGTNEVQSLTLSGSPTGGTFTLFVNGQETDPILYTPQSGGAVTAAEMETALREFVDVRVTAVNSLQFSVEFTGVDGSLDTNLLAPGQNNTGATGLVIAALTQGVSGEQRVNDTTLNNQRFPVVDMDSQGNYIITWTSTGQDGDAPFESNIYAKRFTNAAPGSGPPNPGPGTFFTLIDPVNPSKWGSAVFGTGATITYAFMATGISDATMIDGGWMNTALTDFMPLGAQDEVRRAFADWAAVANVNFVEIPDAGEGFGVTVANSADIRIGAHPITDPMVLGHAFGPPQAGQGNGVPGDLHFNRSQPWQIGLGGPNFDIWNTAIHEIGHAIGLGHIDLLGQVMQPAGADQLNLGPGDILGGQYIYGIRGNAIGGEFLVNNTITDNQRWSSVAVDSDGDFVIAWTSYGQDGAGNGYGAGFNGENGIVARRYDRFGVPVANEFIVNEFRDQNQQFPRVTMDTDGDFAIAWDSYQDRNVPSDVPDSWGVYARTFRPTNINAGPNGEFGDEFRVNTTIAGDQQFAGIASAADGRLIVAWSGLGTVAGNSDTQGVFFQRYNAIGGDDTPPTVGDVNALGSLRIVVSFSEEMSTVSGSTTALESILNEANWGLRLAGVPLSDPLSNVRFGLNEAFNAGLSTTPSNKWEAVLTLNTPLMLQTNYTLTLADDVIDLADNQLDGNYDGTAGGDFSIVFRASADSAVGAVGGEFPVNTTTSGTQDDSAVATDTTGDYVVVWSSATTPTVNGDVRAQRYNSQGIAQGAEFTVHPSTTGNQDSPDISIDSLGNFVVVWSGAGTQDVEGIYARRFDSLGQALDAQPIFVNLGSPNLAEAQLTPAVARNSSGAYAVSWVTKTGTGDQGDVMVRLYSAAGVPLTNELLVNTVTAGRQHSPDVAINSAGELVVTWTSDGQDGDQGGIYARRFNSAGVPQGGEFRANVVTAQSQTASVVTLADTGFFTIAWNSNLQDGNGLGVYLQRYNSAASPLNRDAGNLPIDFRVNQFTVGAQNEVALAADSAGNFIVSWSSAAQDTSGLGIFARVFSTDGTDAFGGEFQVNTTFTGDQRRPAVVRNDDGDVVITWTGPDANVTGIYGQRYRFAATATPDLAPGIAAVRIGRAGNPNALYPIPVGSGEQLRTVDVGRVDQVQITFNDDVIVSQSDLTVTGTTGATIQVTGFSYNAGTRTGTWTIQSDPAGPGAPGPVVADKLTLTLSDAVRDAFGNALDGEWDNPTSLSDPSSSTFSGNGQGGGNFVFKFTVLSGDGNRDNQVTGADYTTWADGFGNFAGDATVRDGDYNGDGFVTGADYTTWADSFGLDYRDAASGPVISRSRDTSVVVPRGTTGVVGRVTDESSGVLIAPAQVIATRPQFTPIPFARVIAESRSAVRARAVDRALADNSLERDQALEELLAEMVA